MKHKLPSIKSQVRICIICEGDEEYEYLESRAAVVSTGWKIRKYLSGLATVTKESENKNAYLCTWPCEGRHLIILCG